MDHRGPGDLLATLRVTRPPLISTHFPVVSDKLVDCVGLSKLVMAPISSEYTQDTISV